MARKYGSQSLDKLRAEAAAQGIDLSEHYAEIERAKLIAAGSIKEPKPPILDNERPSVYRLVTTSAQYIMESAAFLTLLIVNGFMAPALAFVLFIVEFDRIRLGVGQFDPAHASGISLGMMLAYTVIIIVEAYYTYIPGKPAELKEKGSLRKVVSNVIYWLGLTDERRYVTNIDNIRGLGRILQWAIVISAGFGSLQGQFSADDTIPWYERMVLIFTESNFHTFMGILIISLIALITLRAMHWSLYRTYEIVVSIMGGVNLGGTDFLQRSAAYQEEVRSIRVEAERMYLIRLLSETSRKELTEPTIYSNNSSNH